MGSAAPGIWHRLVAAFAAIQARRDAATALRQRGEAIAAMFEGRDWHRAPGATFRAIECLRSVAPFALPDSYVSFLSFSNGGGGPLAVQPCNLELDSAEEVASTHLEGTFREDYPGLFAIGGNGGCEIVAFDLRGSEPYPLVYFHMCGGGLESVEPIAPTFDAALELIGVKREDEEFQHRLQEHLARLYPSH